MKHRLALLVLLLGPLALAGCAADAQQPQARYLTPGTTPVCLLICTVVVTNSEAAQFPVLRQVRDFGDLNKSTTQSASNSSQ